MLGLSLQSMGLTDWFLFLSAAASLLMLASAVYNLFFHPLAHVPGPFWARISGIPSWYYAYRGDRHIWLWRQFQIYGHKIRPEPNTVLFRDPEAHADIYTAKSNVRRANFYMAWRRNERDITTLDTVDVAEHAKKRKILNICFTDRMVRAASSFVIKHIDRWNQLMLEETKNTDDWSSPVNLTDSLDTLIFDIMGDLTFGASCNIKEPGENPFKAIPHSIAEYMRFYYPVARSPFLDLVLWLKPRGLNALFAFLTPPSIQKYFDFLDQSVKNRIALYREQTGKPEAERRQDVFYFLCEARDTEGDGSALDEQALRSEANLLIIAGSDTTSISLTGILFYLASDPWRSQKLVDELEATFDSVDDIVYGPKLLACTYLRACVDEGMRLVPSGVSEMPREVLPGGLFVKGEYYPPGTIVGIAQWSRSRNEEVFGDDGAFRPERWIVDEAAGVTKEAVARLRAGFQPFIAGPTSCVGKNLAMSEMLLTVARTMYRLEFRRAPGSKLGCGSPELGWGARDGAQLQLIDAYISIREGPEVQFRKRSTRKQSDVQG